MSETVSGSLFQKVKCQKLSVVAYFKR